MTQEETEVQVPAIYEEEPEQSCIWDRIESVPALRAEIRRLERELQRATRRKAAPLTILDGELQTSDTDEAGN